MSAPSTPPRIPRAARPDGTPATPVAVPSEVEQVIAQMPTSTPTPTSSAPSNGASPAVDAAPDYSYYKRGGPGTFTTNRGVVLALRPFSKELATKVQRNTLKDRPTPPRTYHEADDKWTVDDDDQEYRVAISEFINRSADIAFNVRVSMGTSLLSVPDGVFPPESDEWIALVTDESLYGAYVPVIRTDTPLHRYIDWLQCYILAEGDITALYDILDEVSGVLREDAVEAAVRSFRDSS